MKRKGDFTMDVRFDGHVQRFNFGTGLDLANDIYVAISQSDEDRAVCRCFIDIMAAKEDESYTKIGELNFYAYSTSRCGLDIDAMEFDEFDANETLFELMDAESGDTANYYDVFQALYPYIYVEDAEEVSIFNELSLIALHRFYIEPEYRGNGLGSFIAENLAKIIFEATNIKPLYAFGVLVPDDKSNETKEIQAKTMIGAGFHVAIDEDGEYIFGKCIFDEDVM